MRTKTIAMFGAVVLMTGCASGYAPGSPQELDRQRYLAAKHECMAEQVDLFQELSPDVIGSACRDYARRLVYGRR